MSKLTKRQKATAGKVDSLKLYGFDDAIAIVKGITALGIRNVSSTAKDGYDGEVAAVSEIAYREPDEVLLFATYWTSTGRFTRYQMRLHGHDKVKITYTHTDSEILIRKA